jgi:thiosulfate/3-mercaptopyruvate sulfurtransferase
MLCDASGVAEALARGELVVDVRGAERFAGKVEPLDTVAGHVPGAVNLPFLLNLDENSRFRSKAELAELWLARTGLAGGSGPVCMCGSGVTACQALLALEVAGHSGGRLYAGSWSEWIRDPARPIARDA